ncbi:FkbM family methyltransferase [Devosia alba]|uniref:FkbM family methyltransferase n=1 Tax=Devosia alba TaxID=3152360 RepID=UPI003264B7E1
MSRLAKLGALALYPATWPALIATRTAAAVEHMQMLQRIRPDTVIDVGGNKGQFALAALAAGASRVVSFEPLASEADLFVRNLGSDSRVTLHRFALAEAAGEATFHVADRPDSSSLLPIGAGQTRAFSVAEASTQTVQLRRLDEVLQPETLQGTTLLKIDVQGAEARVITGASGLYGAIRHVYAEVAFVELYAGQPLAGELIRMLDDAGFALRGVYNVVQSPSYGPTQADLLFENRAMAAAPARDARGA